MSQTLYRNIYWSRFFLVIALLCSIISLGGGAVLLAPFKSVPWLKTDTASFGLYGSCPSSVIDPNWLSQDPEWTIKQQQCALVFSNPSNENITIRDQYILSVIPALGLLVTILALITTSSRNPTPGTIFTNGAVILQAASLVYALFIFINLKNNLAQDGRSVVEMGIAVYFSAGCVASLVAAGLFSYSAMQIRREILLKWTP